MNFKSIILFLFICVGISLQINAITVDSLGLKKENNKTYIVFKVGAKQSLFSILRRYNLSLTEFKQVNPEIAIPVKTGELVFIPLHYLEESPSILKTIDKPNEVSVAPAANEKTVEDGNKSDKGIHIVARRQGLLTIANMHQVTMAQIRKWNNLTSDRLQEGQRLIIAEPSAATSIDKTGLLPSKTEKSPTSTEAKIDMTLPAAKENPAAASTIPEGSTSQEGIRKTIETGIAELIDVPDNSGKYLALHKSAPIGTLVLVKNLANNQSIWVKVIGRLPNTDNKVVIKLSPKAFERLNAIDKRIRAEISYLVQ
ncbi:LysM peptidoglycan-binding domain-containing protein [Aquirufa ecclesiirivi]|uniref:LysM peptidoglycan-binding domain-containing protein n=1 Tax=Aquirufa ecclesiirivi TaxID=2715124 RepID=A0ABT4JDZ2_9BACT|nr:LysM peptidoglycan-binding domain-containing protein [Aquirufa ecclesiirivi]MCZ2474498.1 LysM peptidoglycan-binding domain-containing protein [Aquirufa ecclesiirivi]